MSAAAPRRALTILDCVGIGINGIIGSGIFLLPAAVFRHAGGRSPIAWLLVGGLCFLVGLCFAEAASYTERSGGPYAYARMAFGRELGFAVGFIALASTVLSYTAVSRGLTDNLSAFVPAVSGREVWVGAGCGARGGSTPPSRPAAGGPAGAAPAPTAPRAGACPTAAATAGR